MIKNPFLSGRGGSGADPRKNSKVVKVPKKFYNVPLVYYVPHIVDTSNSLHPYFLTRNSRKKSGPLRGLIVLLLGYVNFFCLLLGLHQLPTEQVQSLQGIGDSIKQQDIFF